MEWFLKLPWCTFWLYLCSHWRGIWIHNSFFNFSFLCNYLRKDIYDIPNNNNLFILNSLTGLGNILIFQTIINISSSLNLLPTKGMTLPFISYGGSSIISSSLIVGFILTLINNAKTIIQFFLLQVELEDIFFQRWLLLKR